MKKLTLILTFLLIVMVIMLGCSDDNPTDSQPEQKAVTWGLIMASKADSVLFFMSVVYDIDGKVAELDSVTCGNGMAELMLANSLIGPSVTATYEDNTTVVSSGDTIEINYFFPSGTGTALVKALDYRLDEPTIQSHSTSHPYDTISTNTGTTITWRPSAMADYYSISLTYDYDSMGISLRTSETIFTTDSSLVIADSQLAFDGRLEFYIYALSGPRPDVEAGNIEGSIINGYVSGIANDRVLIYIGTGIYKAPDISEPNTPMELLESYINTLRD